MTRCAIGRHREAEANRITAVLAAPCLLALAGQVWPAAGSAIGWTAGLVLGLALAVAWVARRAREAARRTR